MHDEKLFSDYEVWGENRQGILNRIQAQMDSWGLVVPAEKPIVFHFGLGEFKNIGETEFWISNEVEAGYCAKYMFVFNDQSCPYHYHKHKHETFYIIKGAAHVRMEDRKETLEEGARLVLAPETKHGFTGAGNCLILEVSMPSIPGDSYFEDKRIGNLGVL